MADIELTRSHSLGVDGGRDAVEKVARELDSDLGIQYEWTESTLRFRGQGTDGRIEVEEQSIQLQMNLSAFLQPVRGRIESEAEQYLDRHFPS